MLEYVQFTQKVLFSSEPGLLRSQVVGICPLHLF